MSRPDPLIVRPMQALDVPESCNLLNEIIAIGGTTAAEEPFTDATFTRAYLEGSDRICCHVALDGSGHVGGFQWAGRRKKLPATCGDIATFARRTAAVRGVGRALFQATTAALRAAGMDQINATIRADNVPGLGYYTKMGFTDHSVARSVPLRDGTPVDRISKRFLLV